MKSLPVPGKYKHSMKYSAAHLNDDGHDHAATNHLKSVFNV